MKITESADALAAMTDAEAQALADKLIAEAPPMAPERAAEFDHLLSVWEAGWRHGLGQVILTGAERDELIASTIAPELAEAIWQDGIGRAEQRRDSAGTRS